MSDTANDAIIPAKPDAQAEKKPDEKVFDAKNQVNANTMLTFITILSVLLAGVSGYTAIVTRYDRTEQRSMDTTARVDKMETAVQRIPVMESQISTMNSAVTEANRKLDSILLRQK